jgi:hypothetical protein
MVRVTLWMQFLLLVLILKQSDAVYDQFTELDDEIFRLETHITRVRGLKRQYDHLYGECKVSIYLCVCVCLHIYI